MPTDLKSTNSLLDFAKFIDHTLLKPEATLEQIQHLIATAMEYGFYSVCLNPCFVAMASKLLKDSEVLVCTVIGFPLGANTTTTKSFETKQAILDGADEIDMVINIGALKAKNYLLVEYDIKEVVKASEGKVVKVILETALLDAEEIKIACGLAQKAGAHFVKTSTGFSTRGATVLDVELMKSAISGTMKIKASGGINSSLIAKLMIEAGASRLGTSSGVAIIEDSRSTTSY